MKPGMKNALVIGLMLLLSLGLILVARFLLPGAELSQVDIQQQIANLSETSPTPAPSAASEETKAADEGQENKGTEAEAYIYIYINGRLSGIAPLGEEQDVTVDQGNGVVNVIHLLPNGFYMASSTCDNQLCVMEGTVTVDNYHTRVLGTSILCLPHNLDLELIVPSHTPDPNAPDI